MGGERRQKNSQCYNVSLAAWSGKEGENISVHSTLQLARYTNLFCFLLNGFSFAGNRLLA